MLCMYTCQLVYNNAYHMSYPVQNKNQKSTVRNDRRYHKYITVIHCTHEHQMLVNTGPCKISLLHGPTMFYIHQVSNNYLIGSKNTGFSDHHIARRFGSFILPTHNLLQKGWDHSPLKACFEESSSWHITRLCGMYVSLIHRPFFWPGNEAKCI